MQQVARTRPIMSQLEIHPDAENQLEELAPARRPMLGYVGGPTSNLKSFFATGVVYVVTESSSSPSPSPSEIQCLINFTVAVLLIFVVLHASNSSVETMVNVIAGMSVLFAAQKAYLVCRNLIQRRRRTDDNAEARRGGDEPQVVRVQVPPPSPSVNAIVPPRARLYNLRSQLLFIDRDFDGLDYEALSALDAYTPPVAPAMTDEEINALPVYKCIIVSGLGPSSSSSSPLKRDGPASSSQQPCSSSGAITATRIIHDLDKQYQTIKILKNDLKCMVCLEEVEEAELIKSLPCMHQFHSDCIDPWLRLKGTCPICKYRVGWPRNIDEDQEYISYRA